MILAEIRELRCSVQSAQFFESEERCSENREKSCLSATNQRKIFQRSSLQLFWSLGIDNGMLGLFRQRKIAGIEISRMAEYDHGQEQPSRPKGS